MQDGNNFNNNGRSRIPKVLLIVAAIFIIAIVATIALVAHDHNTSSDFPKADQGHSTVFQGMNSFISSGLTTDQVNALIKDFSKFSPTAKTISINPGSLSPGPHDPDKDVSFSINFNVTVDSTQYKGTVFYSGLETVRLVLTSGAGKQVFDSSSASR